MTADLMKLVKKWRAEAAAWRAKGNGAAVEVANAYDLCANQLNALSSTGEARVGGEVVFVADICGPCGQVFDAPHDCPLATPAQPKASEAKPANGGAVDYNINGADTSVESDRVKGRNANAVPGNYVVPAAPPFSTADQPADAVAWLRDVDGTGSLHVAAAGDPGAFPVYDHPKASEGKAGGEDDRDRLVGSVLDAWEMLPNDLKCEVEECALGKSLDALFNWMENEQPVPSHVKAPRAVRKTDPGSLKASDAKDAARYQWLRERHWSHSDMCVVVSPREVVRLGAHCPSHDSLDAAIDAAMTATLTAPGADDGQ